MPTFPFVSTSWFAEHIDDPGIRVVEIGSSTDQSVYRAGHVPGAIWLNWKAACWHETDRQFVTPQAMAALFGGLGIGPDTTIVLYGDPIQYGSYAYWTFTMAGHRCLRLLDGGRKKWAAEGRALSQDIPENSAVAYRTPMADQSMRVGRRDVLKHLGQPHRLLLDLRSPEEFSGERVIEYSAAFDHGAERAGHIPGAQHLYFRELLNDDDTIKSPEEIRARFKRAGIDPESHDEVVCYCRLSHRATMAWLAVSQLLGHQCVKIYDGSWTEWGSIVGYPVEQ
jgi:thiosulfate/3-mercaptopyruvate sulfurtransferase